MEEELCNLIPKNLQFSTNCGIYAVPKESSRLPITSQEDRRKYCSGTQYCARTVYLPEVGEMCLQNQFVIASLAFFPCRSTLNFLIQLRSCRATIADWDPHYYLWIYGITEQDLKAFTLTFARSSSGSTSRGHFETYQGCKTVFTEEN